MAESRAFQEFLRDFLQDNEDTSKLIGSDGSILHQPLQINGNHLILMSTDFTCQMAATLVHFFTTATQHFEITTGLDQVIYTIKSASLQTLGSKELSKPTSK